jgi:hypothetical protein
MNPKIAHAIAAILGGTFVHPRVIGVKFGYSF